MFPEKSNITNIYNKIIKPFKIVLYIIIIVVKLVFYFIERCKRKISPEDVQLLYSNQPSKKAKIQYKTAIEIFSHQDNIIEVLQSKKQSFENMIVGMEREMKSLGVLIMANIKETYTLIE